MEETAVIKEFAKFADTCTSFCRTLSREPSFRERSVQGHLHAIRTVFSKWAVDILAILYVRRSVGFQELRRTLGTITPGTLSRKLKDMEAQGLVVRGIVDERPPKVRYALTEKGLLVSKLGEPVVLYLRYAEGTKGKSGRY